MKTTSRCVSGYCASIFILVLTGCAATSHVITGQPRDPIEPALVTVYTTALPVYEEIGIVEASSRNSLSVGDQSKMDAVIERLKEEAASLGANGLVLQETSTGGGGRGVGTGVGVSSGGGVYVSTGIFASSSEKNGRGLAIHVPPE